MSNPSNPPIPNPQPVNHPNSGFPTPGGVPGQPVTRPNVPSASGMPTASAPPAAGPSGNLQPAAGYPGNYPHPGYSAVTNTGGSAQPTGITQPYQQPNYRTADGTLVGNQMATTASTTPSVETPGKSGSSRGKFLVITHIIALILGIGCGVFGGYKYWGGKVQYLSQQLKQTEEKQAKADQKLEELTGEDSAGKKTDKGKKYNGVMKEELVAEEYKLTVTEKATANCVKELDSTSSECYRKPSGVYLVLTIKIKNTGSENMHISESDFILTKDGQQVKSVEVADEQETDSSRRFNGSLQPTISKTLTVYFDVDPVDAKAKGWKLQVANGKWGNLHTLAVDLDKTK